MFMHSETQLRELDRRNGHDIEVALLWDPDSDRVFLAVEDHQRQESIRLEVPAADALHAFHHPYVYIGSDPSYQPLAA